MLMKHNPALGLITFHEHNENMVEEGGELMKRERDLIH